MRSRLPEPLWEGGRRDELPPASRPSRNRPEGWERAGTRGVRQHAGPWTAARTRSSGVSSSIAAVGRVRELNSVSETEVSPRQINVFLTRARESAPRSSRVCPEDLMSQARSLPEQ